MKTVGDNAVHLDIKEHYPKPHPVFNVSLLTPYKKPATDPFPAIIPLQLQQLIGNILEKSLLIGQRERAPTNI
jgi:hypothetical protein